MDAIDGKGQKLGKRKSVKSSRKSSAFSKKRKQLHAKDSISEEVVTMDQSENAEHTQLLLSVTGKMKQLSQCKDDPDNGMGTGDVKGHTEELAGKERDGSAGMGKAAAAQYLVLWNSQRDQWTFRKKTQYWLLQNMYKKKKVSKATFKLMLLYLDGLRGNQRALAKERAEKVVGTKDSDRESKIAHKRARSVLRVLSD